MAQKMKMLNANGTSFDLIGEGWPISAYEGYSIPIVYLTGNLGGMTKDNEVTLNYIYKERAGTCTLKWQGSSSLNLTKKNYTIKFDTAFEVISGWGAQKKYVLKANFVDSSHARNVCCAKLWGQIVKSRAPANATLNALPNGGAVDGFPIILSINGKFAGLYTWNIPKDGWMFGMGSGTKEAIVCAELNNNGAVAFKGLATMEEDSNGELDFDLEYSSDDQKDWVLASLNRLLSAVMDSDGTNITYGITPYLDWESAIDYYIHAALTANYDGLFRNYLLATYDGVKWFFTGYDMDVVLGLRAMGRYFYPANHSNMSFTTMAAEHKLFALIWKYMRPQFRARYNELRAAAMSVENVANTFTDYIADIPAAVYAADQSRWRDIPSTGANGLAHIVTYYDLRCRNVDEWIQSTSGETALPEQINPDSYTVTTALTNCTTSNSASAVEKNSAYTATITANSGYELDSVTVTMGGVDVTSTVYANGVVSISAVTGDLVITASATAKAEYTYTNQVPISTDSSGNVYNTTGWKGDTRLSASSGSEKEQADSVVTGFIPATANAVIRFKKSKDVLIWDEGSNVGACSLVYYDSSRIYLGGITIQPSPYGICTNDHLPTGSTANYGIVTAIAPNNANIAYVRLSSYVAASSDAGLIVTVNEEITD